jgi:secondary thiamine-phosphate synthase enzyme
MNRQKALEFRTRGRGTADITADIQLVVTESGIKTGLCNVFLQHTSASLILCENADPNVSKDLEMLLQRLAPDGDPDYAHDTEGPDDMAAHARSVPVRAPICGPLARSGYHYPWLTENARIR